MRQTNCYYPEWNEVGKLTKHGSYCCWEAVVARAVEELPLSDGPHNEHKLQRIRDHINELVGCVVGIGPHWSRLVWFARDEPNVINSPTEFLTECSHLTDKHTVVAVRMTTDGVTHEVMCSEEDISEKFTSHLDRPWALQGPLHHPQSFQIMRKKLNKDRDLTVFHWPGKNGLPLNQYASNIFKMQIYGDVLMVQQSKEPCFMHRERFVNYFNTNFQEQFTQKTRRKDVTTFTPDDYALVKEQMTSDFQQVEALSSVSALEPGELAKAAVMPAPTGKEMAQLLKSQGQTPPPKKKRPRDPPHSDDGVGVE